MKFSLKRYHFKLIIRLKVTIRVEMQFIACLFLLSITTSLLVAASPSKHKSHPANRFKEHKVLLLKQDMLRVREFDILKNNNN